MHRFRLLVRFLVAIAIAAGWLSAVAPGAEAAPGDLDPTFGSGGLVTTDLGGGDELMDAALQSDGKIVVVGFTTSASAYSDVSLARYTTAGALDSTFGTGGKVITSVATTSDQGNAVAIQSDGKIVVAGWTENGSFDFLVLRYTSSGALDSTFGTGGTVVTPISASLDDRAEDVVIQPDGKIVVAGTTSNGSYNDFALARYTSSGALDTTFGSGGKVITAVGSGNDDATSMVLQPDGKIVVGGSSAPAGTFNDDFALVRYTPSGGLDTTFGSGGKTITPIGTSVDGGNAVALQSDGKIVMAGDSSNGSSYDFALARFTSSGALDYTFGSGGKVVTPIGSDNDFAHDVSIQADGKIVAAGESLTGSGFGGFDFSLARYTVAGALDPTFGANGKVLTPIGQGSDTANALLLQTDGKIVVAGTTSTSHGDDFALARYVVVPGALSVGNASVTEGDTGTKNMTFTVSLTNGGQGGVSVDFTTVSDTAGSADFIAKSGNLTIPQGQSSATLTVAIKGDLIDEPDETFFVQLSNAVGATISDGTGIGTILDNDPTPGLSVSDATVTEGNSGTVGLTFTLTLSNPSSDYVFFDYATSDGTATAPSDYTARSGTKTFKPGAITKTVTVFVNGETAQEPDETLYLNVFDPDGAVISDGQGVGTIVDDDRPAISINDVSKNEPASGATTTMTFTVTLSKAGTSTITVAYATADGTALAGEDYTAKSGTLSFAPGTLTKNISITIKHDNQVGNESFYVNLSNPTNATIADGQGVGTIIG